MISIDITLDERQERAVAAFLGRFPERAKTAAARALNRAAEGARTDAVKKVCEMYEIKPAAVRKTIHIARASAKNLRATFLSEGPTVPLINFKVTPKKPRVKGEPAARMVIAGVEFGSRRKLPHAFIQRTGRGHIRVFSREGKSRYPIKEKYGPAVPQMLGNPRALEFIERRARERLDRELWHQIAYLMGGGR